MRGWASRSSCCTAFPTPAISGAGRGPPPSRAAFAPSCPTCVGVDAAASHSPFRSIDCPALSGMSPASWTRSASSVRMSSGMTGVRPWPGSSRPSRQSGAMASLCIERAHVVGHDWSAAVAWLLAALAPERVDRLVAISVGAPGAAAKPTLEELQKGWYRLLFLFEGIAEELLQRDDWSLFRLFLDGGEATDAYVQTLS